MKSVAVVLFFIFMSVCVTAHGEEAALKPRTEGGITFISGGVGQDEIQYLRTVEGDYNLRLLFAVMGTGEFLSDVNVKLMDAKGKTVLETVSDGPRFMVKLAPGVYRVTAVNNGTAITRTVRISAKRASSESFFWKPGNREKPAE